MEELINMARTMRMLQAEKEQLEETVKAINIQLDTLRLRDIPEAMAEADIRTLTIEGVGRVQLAMDLYAGIIADRKDEAYAWLQEYGYDGLIVPYVQPSTLKAAIKKGLLAGQEWPEELFNVQPFTRASIVKA